MGFIKTEFMGDAIKKSCEKISEILDWSTLFTVDDGCDFLDGSVRAYQEHINSLPTNSDDENRARAKAEAHMAEIRNFLIAQKEGPAAEEATVLLSYINSFEIFKENADVLKSSEKNENGRYEKTDSEKMRDMTSLAITLSGANGGMSFSKAVSELNRKTGFSFADKPEMTGLTCLCTKIDSAVMECEAGNIKNLDYEKERRDSIAKLINGEVEKTKAAYNKLKEYTERKFLPSQVPEQRKAAKERIAALDKDLSEAIRKTDSVEYKIRELETQIRILNSDITRHSESLRSKAKEISLAGKKLDEHTERVRETFKEANSSIDYRTGEVISNGEITSDDTFIRSLSEMSEDELRAVDKGIYDQLEAWARTMDEDQVKSYEASEQYFKNLAANPKENGLPAYENLATLADSKQLKNLDKNDPLKLFYDNTKKEYDTFYKAERERTGFLSIFSKTESVSAFDVRVSEIVNKANADKALFLKGKELSESMQEKEALMREYRRDPEKVSEFRNWLRQNGHIQDANTFKPIQLFTLDYYGKLKMGLKDDELKAYHFYDDFRFSEEYRARRIDEKDVFRHALKEGFNGLLTDISKKYEEKKNAVPGYREVKELNARKYVVKMQIASIIAASSEEAKKMYGVDSEKIKDNSETMESLKKIAVYGDKSSSEMKDNLAAEKESLRKKEDELEHLKAQKEELDAEYNNIHKKIESNKKVLTVCDNIESLAGECRKQAERAAKYVEEFKNSYPVITDTRGERIKTKVEEFCSRIGLNKGFRSNSEKFEDMDRNLKALSEYLTAGGGPKTTEELKKKIENVYTATSEYIKAKGNQKMVIGTSRRFSRLSFARELKIWSKEIMGNIDIKCPKVQPTEAENKILNLSNTEIPVPEYLELDHSTLVKNPDQVANNVEMIMQKV